MAVPVRWRQCQRRAHAESSAQNFLRRPASPESLQGTKIAAGGSIKR